jgi:2-polyprenyl-6-methoxyphenol hydroxylase-like FAD-dependent oxidoreductase
MSIEASSGVTDHMTGRAPVLVVGAGPTGLLLAAELQRREVPCVLIDERSGPQHWDRATVVHPRSLELFESLGLSERFLDVGTPQRGAKVHSSGDVLGAFDLSGCGSSYPYSLGVSEEVTESILTEYLGAQGGEVARSSRLIGLTARADGVTAEVDRDGERIQMDASWVVGCDGLHSPTREGSGIGFDGHELAAPWAVFDATLDPWTEVFDLTFVYLEAVPVILTALPGRRWRVYLRPSSPESDLVADATSTIRRYYPSVSFVDVENPTRFHCHTKVATTFRAGRVLLAGDAAHLCSPAQGHGMNTGLQDAANLAWKLALVHKGWADPALLDSYEAERLPVARTIGLEGDDFEQAELATDANERKDRDRSMRAMLADPTARQHEIVAEAELDVEYSDSPIVIGDAHRGLAPGQRLPDTIPTRWSETESGCLHEHTRHAGHTIVLLYRADADGGAVSDLLGTLLDVVAGSPMLDAVLALGIGEHPTESAGYIEPSAADLLDVDGITLFAVRPDGYIGLRADHDHLAALARYQATVLGHS